MKFDTAYPEVFSPLILEESDGMVAKIFKKEIKSKIPELNEWKWVQGIEVDPCEGLFNNFESSFWYWVNQRYKIGTGRLVQAFENDYAVNYIDLLEGYRLLAYTCDPIRKKKIPDANILLLEFLYRDQSYSDRADGTRRLRKFIKYVEEIPQNPITGIILHPAGCDVLDRHSPHLKKLNFESKKHTTEDLIKIYKYWLGIEPTNIIGYMWDSIPFYRVKYNPVDPIRSKVECSCPKVFE